MTFKAFASNFKLRPRLLLLPSPAMTMKLDVIFDNALVEIPSNSATLNEAKYLFWERFETTDLNCSFSVFSEGKNLRGHQISTKYVSDAVCKTHSQNHRQSICICCGDLRSNTVGVLA